MKIAIVGTGISGLVTAHLLQRDHEVMVYEASDRIGGHTNTVDVEVDGKVVGVDTGFIVYNEKTYPNFSKLLARLGVATQPSNMSFGLHCERTGVEWASHDVASVLAQPRNLLRPDFRRMLWDIARFNREAPRLLAGGDEKASLGAYLVGAGYSSAFIDGYVLPMGAAIWSASPKQFLEFPAASFVRFFHNHGLLSANPSTPWRVVSGGSSQYLAPLIHPFADRIVTGCGIRRVRRDAEGVQLTLRDGTRERFDRVVLAVHSDQALALLADPSPLEQRVLSAISYQENEAILHTDRSVMPERRRAWASWNYRIPRREHDRVFVSYHMNRLQSLDTSWDFFVTLNALDAIDPEEILTRITYHHPVFDAAAMEAQRLHPVLDGERGTHYCGAYWGFGFHEDGVKSALAVASKFGLEL